MVLYTTFWRQFSKQMQGTVPVFFFSLTRKSHNGMALWTHPWLPNPRETDNTCHSQLRVIQGFPMARIEPKTVCLYHTSQHLPLPLGHALTGIILVVSLSSPYPIFRSCHVSMCLTYHIVLYLFLCYLYMTTRTIKSAPCCT